ncbi:MULTISPECIES: hypothetical protein [Pseudomonas]|uniref:Uncharacterized protein n=1 Tax=Pseudomonas donghuensis TaxID=1163398 RepID=A0AAP0X7H4_9PSED|nr:MULTISPECIES: hypothetical protein [Pseudomonas]KDN97858.2 hypothetical protein BV82_4163 [Pseudomonas donghuensis]MCP6693077.1 hypothetical protein [Pseudomonas donghuensis]MDF9894740.1 hypothetical protein [Pseudomonas vranovensis]QHF29745.1 hypothetical protein PspR32_18840 [Pseudomonas sp. R32]
MKALALVIISGFLTIPTAWATQDAQHGSSWRLEPESFIGLNLKGDFLKDIPECAAKAAQQSVASLCRELTEHDNTYLLQGEIPFGGKKSNTTVQLNNGKIQRLIISGNAETIRNLSETLTTTYGDPTTWELSRLESKSGYSFVSEVLIWSGQHVSMKLQRNNDDINTYSIIVINNNYAPESATESSETIPAEKRSTL